MKIVVHEVHRGYIENPELYIDEPVWDWQQSEKGKWVITHSRSKPVWVTVPDYVNDRLIFRITADLEGNDITYFNLKWGNYK